MSAPSLEPLILTVAPNGAYKQAHEHPALPLDAPALARTAARCLDAGACMIHLHVRDAQGRHSLDVDAYREATRAVRAAVGQALVVQVTSESGRVYAPEQQMEMVRTLRPEAVSVGLREIDQPSVGTAGLAAFFDWLARENVMTQVILYDADDVLRWHALRASGVVRESAWFVLFVLGRYVDRKEAGRPSAPTDLLPFLAAHADRGPWAACAFGAAEHACTTAAAALGGHVRVGFENNLCLKDGSTAPDNAALVRQAAEAAACLGRPLASADAVRQQFARR